MSSPLALLLLAGGVLSPATPSAPFGLALQEEVLPRAVGREIALRAAAPGIGRLGTWPGPAGASVKRADLQALISGAIDASAPPWVSEVTALDAAARAGVLLAEEGLTAGGAERPEVWAAGLRVLDTEGDGEGLAAALAAGLAAPFHAVRLAAVERLARALVAHPEVSPFLPQIASKPELSAETCGQISATFAQAGARSRTLAEAALEARIRACGGDPLRALEELFDLWLDRPIAADAVAYLRTRFQEGARGRGLVEALALVAEGQLAERRGAGSQGAGSLGADVGAALAALGQPLVLPLDEWDLDERAERVAGRPGVSSLGLAMLDQSAAAGLPERTRLRWVRGAAWAAPLQELLSRTQGLSEPEALEMWRVLTNRQEPLPVAETARWLRDPRGEVREAAAREVGRRLTAGSEPELLGLAVELLVDFRAEVRSLAFSWLCDTTVGPSSWGSLREAFDREGEVAADGRLTERQERWLAQLPRGVPVPAFRDLVMQLVRRAGRRDPAVVELLAPFKGDGEVAGLLRRAFEEELCGLEAAAGYPARLMSDARAAALASALAAVQGQEAAPILINGLHRSMWLMHGEESGEDARPQLPKTACGLLERSAAGRAALAALLGEEAPVRVRYEAALQLSKVGGSRRSLLAPETTARVAARILKDYERVDRTLRARGLEALGRGDAPAPESVARFLERLSAPGGDPSEREMAIGVMGRLGVTAPLRRLSWKPLAGGVPDLMDVEAAVAATRASAGPAGQGRRALVELLDLVEAVDLRLAAVDLPELEREALGQLRGTALVSAATAAGLDPMLSGDSLDPIRRRLAAALTRRPIDEGPSDIARRFRGEDLGAVRFRWSAEVAAVEALPALAGEFTADGASSAALDGVDGRLLVMMGELSRREGRGGEEAERLLERGLFAMGGEPRTRAAARDLTFGRAALGRVILDGFGSGPGPGAGSGADAARWERASRQSTMLLVDWRQGRIGRAILEAEFGVTDAAARRAPEARLAALSRVFRGRAALARGEAVGVAQAWADRARDWAILDHLAGEALAALDQAIDLEQR